MQGTDNTEAFGAGASRRRPAAREQIPFANRLGYSAAEFAGLFGRSATWGYRQIYAGRVKPISDCGRILVPRSEVDSFLARRSEYNPKPKPTPKGELNGSAKPKSEDEASGQPS
jgi:hypothetical protein